MKIGFTGTKFGMTKEQKDIVETLLTCLCPEEVHHGDCIGADSDFHSICESLSIKIHIHPPINNRKRAYCKGQVMHEAKKYLVRNQEIVNSSDRLIATPKEKSEQVRSGTWATIRKARKKGIQIYIITPEGNRYIP